MLRPRTRRIWLTTANWSRRAPTCMDVPAARLHRRTVADWQEMRQQCPGPATWQQRPYLRDNTVVPSAVLPPPLLILRVCMMRSFPINSTMTRHFVRTGDFSAVHITTLRSGMVFAQPWPQGQPGNEHNECSTSSQLARHDGSSPPMPGSANSFIFVVIVFLLREY